MTREEIRIVLGIDNSRLSRDVNRSNAMMRSFERGMKSTFSRIGSAFVAMFGVQKVLQSLRQVSDELDKLYADIDARRFKDDQRRKQLEALSPADRENILAGDAQMAALAGDLKNFAGRGAGLWAFAFGTVKEVFKETGKTKDILHLLFGWGDASVRAAEAQREIVNKMREAAQLASAEDAKKAKEEQDRKRELEQIERRKAWQKQALEDGIKAFKAAQAERKEREAILRARQKEAQAAFEAYQAAVMESRERLRGMSDVSLAEAIAITEGAMGPIPLPGLRMSREQMMMVAQTQLLQRLAQQARLNGNPALADQLSMQRSGLLSQMGFLPQSERDPLALQRIAEAQAEHLLALRQCVVGTAITVRPED